MNLRLRGKGEPLTQDTGFSNRAKSFRAWIINHNDMPLYYFYDACI